MFTFFTFNKPRPSLLGGKKRIYMPMTEYNVLEEELSRPSVFKDESKLSIDFLPSKLLYRELELRFLARHFLGLLNLEKPKSSNLLVVGGVGIGKTSLAKTFGKMLTESSRKRNIPVKYVHINCRTNNTPYLIFQTIARELSQHVPARGYSTEEIVGVIGDLLRLQQVRLFLVLDEFDFVALRGGTEIIYPLTRIHDTNRNENINTPVSLLLIARSPAFLERMDLSTASSLGHSVLRMRKYSQAQLVDIIQQRVNLAFKEGVVDKEAIRLAADIASELGDARHAIELIWYAGKYADEEQSPYVFPDHVRQAKSSIHPVVRRETIYGLGLHKLVLLLGIVRQLKHSKLAYIKTSDAIQEYKMACEEFTLTPRKHTQLWQYLKELAIFDLIQVKPSGKGYRGKTTFISLPDVSTRQLENELLSLIQTTLK